VADDKTDVDRYYKHLSAVRSKRTAQSYSAAAERFEEYLFTEKLNLEDAPPGVFDGFVGFLSDQKLGPASIRLMTVGAKKYVDFLRKIGRGVPKSIEEPDLPKIEKNPIKSLTTRQLQAFLAVTDRFVPEPSRVVLKLLPFCGLRVSEITSLRLTNVIKKEGTLYFAFNGKGGKYREVPLESFGTKILINYLSGVRRKIEDPVYLFPESPGKNIGVRTIQTYAKMVREEMGVDFVTPHTLRKTYATMLIDRGVQISTVMALMGHSSMNTSLQHYIEVKSEKKVEAVNRLGGQNG